MNNKGFTLVELLATLVVLSLVVGLSVGAFSFSFGNAKEKTEEVFVDSLRDAIDMYLSSEIGSLKIGNVCSNPISKKHNPSVKLFKVSKNGNPITFNDVINSSYKPLTESDFVNPANDDATCNVNAVIDVYRDEDFVYYYSVNKSELNCLNNIGGEYDSIITNLPEGFSCD